MVEYIKKVLYYYVVFYTVFIITSNDRTEARHVGNPAAEFTRHTLVRPTVYHGRTKREIESTRGTPGDHHKLVTVAVDANGEEYMLDLVLNEDVVSKNHVISYQKDGQTVLHRPSKEELDICQYSGTVRGRRGSWVAVSTCRGISGVIHDGNTTKYIEPAGGNTLTSQHFFYDHADLITHPQFVDDDNILLKRLSQQTRGRNEINRSKRETDIDTNQKRYVELALVADHAEFMSNEGNVTNVQHKLQHITNILNATYAPLNISITLVLIKIWSLQDEIRLDENATKTFKNFMDYVDTMSVPNTTFDYAHLLTHTHFAESVVGKAYKGSICDGEYSIGISGNDGLSDSSLIASTIAHELGHTLGMDHDSQHCSCPTIHGGCIMSSTVNINERIPTQWSSCSRSWLAATYAKELDYCLRNVPNAEPVSGNGIIEAGE